MDHGFAAVAEFIFLLDDSGAIGRRTLLDDGGPIAIAVAILMRLADRHAGTDRTDVNTDLIRERRGRDSRDYGSRKEIFPHLVLLQCRTEGMRECDTLFLGT